MLCGVRSFINAQRICHIRHYLAVVSWCVIIHIPIGLTLIIAVIGWNQLDIGRLRKRGFKLNGFCIIRLESSDSIVVHCLELLVYVVSTSCAHRLLLFQFWFIVGSYQLTVQPHHKFIFPNSEWGGNRYHLYTLYRIQLSQRVGKLGTPQHFPTSLEVLWEDDYLYQVGGLLDHLNLFGLWGPYSLSIGNFGSGFLLSCPPLSGWCITFQICSILWFFHLRITLFFGCLAWT